MHKLDVKFGEIIWFQNIVKTWVDWTIWLKKLVGIIKLRNRVGKAYSVLYSKVVLLSLLKEPFCSSVCGGSPGVTYIGEWNILPGQALCLTPLEEEVLIVRDGCPNCPTRWF